MSNNIANTYGETGIACSQINLHHCHAAVQEHNTWMTSSSGPNFKISLIQEPYLSGKDFKISGFSKDFQLFVGKTNCKTRACILLTKNIKA